MSGKYLDLDGSTEYASKSSPVNLDLNGSEMISAAADRDFEVEGYNWAGAGNHSIDGRSTEDKKAGSYSLKFTTSGAGDATTNHLKLPYSYFTALVSGKKYTIEMWVRGVGILGSELVTNGTDWTDTNGDGLANNWQLIYPTNISKSIVTGNGFDGNAQRVETTANGATVLLATNGIIVTSGKAYELTFKYRGTNNGGAYSIQVGYANFTYVGLLTNNTGNCVSKTYRFVATSTSYLSFYIFNIVAGAYIEVDDVSLKEITRPSITIAIGNQTKTITNISCVPGTFTKLVLNLKATANEVNQDLKIYCNQADTLYMDSVSVTQAYDAAINIWCKVPSSFGSNYPPIFRKGSGSSNQARIGIQLDTAASNGKAYFSIADQNSVVATGSITSTIAINDSSWRLLSLIFDHLTGIASFYINGELNIQSTARAFGKMSDQATVYIGYMPSITGYLAAFIGELQFARAEAIEDSDFSPSNAYTNGISSSYTGGGAQVVAHYKWAGDNMTEVLYDHSGNGNNLTGTNLDMTDVGTTPDYPSHYKESLAGTVRCSGHDAAELKSKILLQGSVKCSDSAAGGLRSFESLQGSVECSGHDAASLKSKVKLQGEVRASSQVHMAVRRKSEFDLLHLKITEET